MNEPDKPFFVGYLATPPGLRRFYWVIVPVLLLIVLLTAIILATGQQNTGRGVWQVNETTTVTGHLSIDPYPIVETADGQSVILVVQGKQGANRAVEGFAGQAVDVSGIAIRRGGWFMLEIPATGAIKAAQSAIETRSTASRPLGDVVMQGEIVDSKCFLGVMKPGAGKVHRACASLCLLGGIPPMLVARSEDGRRYGYLLVDADGASLSRRLAGQVAVPVSVSGSLEQRGDLTYLRLMDSIAGISRLGEEALLAYGESLAVDPAEPMFCGIKPSANEGES